MKKILFILAFAIIGFAAFAQSTLDIEGGYIPRSEAVDWNDTPALELDKDVLYIDLSLRLVALEYLFVGGSCTTYMVLNDTNSFYPFYMSYVFNAGLKINNVELGYSHRCSHAMATVGYVQDPLYKLDSSSDRVYLKMSFKF